MKLTGGAIFSHGEENTHRILDDYLRSRPYRIYKEVALNRVIEVSGREITDPQEWSFYGRASLDFVVCRSEPPHPWELAIEYDSRLHDDDDGRRRDRLKNRFCERAGLPLLRVRADHVTKREGVPFLRYMLDLYFGEKAVQGLVDRGELSWDEEYFSGTEFDGTRRLQRKLRKRGIAAAAMSCLLPPEQADRMIWYRVTGGSCSQPVERAGDWTIGSAKAKVLRGWNREPDVLLAVERKALLAQCAPNQDVPGIHGWFVANQLARFLCFQEIIRKLDAAGSRC